MVKIKRYKGSSINMADNAERRPRQDTILRSSDVSLNKTRPTMHAIRAELGKTVCVLG